MFDAALIQQRADAGIEIAIVERFIAEAGSDNPLAISITSGNRVILPEAPRTADEAMQLLQHFVGTAVVRVGVTQYPAGLGITDASALTADLVDACGNIRMGSALFGKVYRIAAHAHGMPSGEVFGEAITAWRTGSFEGKCVFAEPDPGPLVAIERSPENTPSALEGETAAALTNPAMDNDQSSPSAEDPNQAGIRIDLSGIGGGTGQTE
jgi:hypothetical protein